MKPDLKRLFRKTVAVTALFCMTTQTTFAALLNLAQEPLAVSQVPPKVMLTITKDQQLYKKAYNDYTDLDEDGSIETTYKHTVEYFGYFDPNKCYVYVNSRFEPQANSPTKLCSGQWSGNFLNWASMSRMDAVRKLLYGGLRFIDEAYDARRNPAPMTVLERAFLPTDAHAWAKYYNPDPADPKNQPPINQLTPFNPPTTPTQQNVLTTPAFQIPNANGDYTLDFTTAITGVQRGDQIILHLRNNFTQRFTAAVLDITNKNRRLVVRVNVVGTSGGGNHTDWTLINLSSPGISMCNVTLGASSGSNMRSSTNSNPPLLRVAQGNFALWSANERVQCQWFEERSNLQSGFAGGLRSNGNQASLSEINASAENPMRSVHALSAPAATNGDYIVRVKVCDPALFDGATNKEMCKRYPNGNLKPIGILQEYGDSGKYHFGLMTGSYAKNISGGVLRKNPGPLTDEVRVDTDGTFREANVDAAGNPDGTYRDHPYQPRSFPRTTSSAASPPGIINTLNYMRIFGYEYAGGTYIGATGDNCTYQLTSFTENQCTSWGNPMSEIFFETVRYLAGRTASPAYTYTVSGSKDNELGLPLANWRDPLTSANYCANLNVLLFNSSVADNDDDLRTRTAADINGGSSTIAGLTDTVGNSLNENINGQSFFVGKVLGSTAPADPGWELCTAKNITALGSVSGICPEGPTTAGSYLMAGIAHQARTNFIRTDLASLVQPDDTKSLRVTTYGIQLSSNTPELLIQGNPGQTVRLLPIYRLRLSASNVGGGGLVDMRIVRMDNSGAIKTGKVYVNWEDSEQGGDYDQDMWGIIEWALNTRTNRITITTNAVSASTANPQGFGYAISGTTRDGPHFHSGIYGFNYTDPTGVLGCTNCNLVGSGGQVGPQSVTYDLAAGAAAGSLKDPLWYAAKYGGFIDSNGNRRPDVQSEYDLVRNNGTGGADGIPDNYFLVTNPLGLVDAIRRALGDIGKDSSGTAVMANSTSLSTTSRIYQARYDPDEWSGQLLAKEVDPVTRQVAAKATWDAGLILNKIPPGDRVILTFDDASTRDGIAFRPATISSTLRSALDRSPVTGTVDGLADDRLNYLRGDRTREIANGGIFRTRKTTVLGDIANSDPTYVGPPSATSLTKEYSEFRQNYFKRTPMIYVGANGGMVHGFDAVTGAEKLAYIPSKTFQHLNKLTNPTYAHRFYVDGPPEAADAVVNSQWRTVLVGGLGGGGQGLYALDITNPGGTQTSDFTEANASRLVLWEFNDTDDPQLGYVYSKPVVRLMANNRWAAVVAGGYNNSEGDSAPGTGRAYLFVIFLDGPSGPNRTWVEGTDYIKIDTGVGTAATPNGLGAVMVADANGDGKADFAYAGDLTGSLWKFDLRSPSPANWTNASNRVVLFRSADAFGNPQPITGPAEATLHPTGQGFIIAFGTGKYLETTDTVAPFRFQSFYGIWDKNDKATNIATQTVVNDRTQLLHQVITASGSARTVPNQSPNWSAQMGWYMDFPSSDTTGERSVFRPLLLGSRLIFTTLIPMDDPCAGGGTSHLMVVDPTTGGRVNGNVLDVNRDGQLNDSDMVSGVYASGIQSTVGITPTPVIVKGGPTITPVSAEGSKVYGSRAPALYGESSMIGYTFMGGPMGIAGGLPIGLRADWGRVSWREIIN